MHFSSLFALAGLASAMQFPIAPVQKAVASALATIPDFKAYTGPVKPAPPKPSGPVKTKTDVADASAYWLESIKHQGVSAFGASGYTVFRSVKDYGAKGDGSTDDTAAIQAAIAAGNRCGQGCASSTTSPAIVYFPAGTYIISSPIFDYYYTMLMGNPNDKATIKATSGFSGGWLIDADPYFTENPNWVTTNVFMRQVRNLVIDTTAVAASNGVSGIHWPTSQATSLQNVVFNLNSQSGTKHIGVFSESGSAGFMTDVTFNGGNIGLDIGNQQFTIRGLTFNGVNTAISHFWDWGFTYSGLSINNCQVGIDISAGGTTAGGVGSIVLIDSTITNTPIGIKTSLTSSSTPATAGSVILENVVLSNVATAVQDNGQTALAGGSMTIAAWGQGHKYVPTGPNFFEGTFTGNSRPSSLVSGGKYYTRSKPQYETLALSSFSSARDAGAKGDGNTDDTAALQSAINAAASAGKVLFVDAGTYKVTKTLSIPPGAKLVGEAFSVIMSSGSFFNDASNPKPVVQVGTAGQTGQVEWSDMIVAGQGAQAGATLIEWNLATSGSTPSGMWDVHTRSGGFAGSNLQVGNCPTGSASTSACTVAFMLMHITKSASGLYMENNWLWTADHDIDDASNTQITVYSGRGMLVESTGPVWLWASGVEHNVLYQYQFSSAQNVFMGFIQTETPYYQPSPQAPGPIATVSSLNDPTFAACSGQGATCAMAWGLRVINSSNLYVYGAGLYSFFNSQSTDCSSATRGSGTWCQQQIADFEGSNSHISIYSLSTVSVQNMIVSGGGTSVVAKASDNLNTYNDCVALYQI